MVLGEIMVNETTTCLCACTCHQATQCLAAHVKIWPNNPQEVSEWERYGG